jgi:hypothetical protein
MGCSHTIGSQPREVKGQLYDKVFVRFVTIVQDLENPVYMVESFLSLPRLPHLAHGSVAKFQHPWEYDTVKARRREY